MRFQAMDFLALQQLNSRFGKNLKPEDLVHMVTPEPRVNISESEKNQVLAVDMKAVFQEYKERVTAPMEDPNRVSNLAVVLDKHCPVDKCGNAAELGLDAFELQLAARGLMTRGQNAVLSSVFTTDYTNRFLFTEYIRRVLIQPPVYSSKFALISDLVAGTEIVPSEVVKMPSISSTEKAKAKQYIVAEGASMPKVSFVLTDSDVYSYKLGVVLELTYKTLRNMTMNLVQIYLNMLGENMQRDQALDCVNRLVENAASGNTTASAGVITHKEFVKEVAAFENTFYNADVCVYGATVEGQLLDNDVFYDARNFDLIKTARLSGVGGVMHKLIPETNCDLSTTKLAYVDKNKAAVDFVEAGSNISETDKYIDSQIEAFSFSKEGVIGVLDTNATRVQIVES